MNKALAACIAVLALFVFGCGEKTKGDLMRNAELSGQWEVEGQGEKVYRNVVDKLTECARTAPYFERSWDDASKHGEIALCGTSGSRYTFLATVDETGFGKTRVAAYSSVTTGFYPQFVEMVHLGAFDRNGCPKHGFNVP